MARGMESEHQASIVEEQKASISPLQAEGYNLGNRGNRMQTAQMDDAAAIDALIKSGMPITKENRDAVSGAKKPGDNLDIAVQKPKA